MWSILASARVMEAYACDTPVNRRRGPLHSTRPALVCLLFRPPTNTIRQMVGGEAKGTASCTHRFFGMFHSCTADHSDVARPTAPPVRALSLQLRGQYRKRPKVHEARNGRLQAIPRRDAAFAASRTEWKASLAWLPSQSVPTWRRPLTDCAYCVLHAIRAPRRALAGIDPVRRTKSRDLSGYSRLRVRV